MTTISSYSGETREESNNGKIRSVVENRNLDLRDLNTTIGKSQSEKFVSIPAQHPRYRRNIQQISESGTEMKQCKNFTLVIKYEDRYEVMNNFSVKYEGKIYPYDMYRVKNDGLYVCNSSDDLIQQRWRIFTLREKQRIPYKHCNVSVDSFYHENYTLFKDFNIFLKPTSQNFTRDDYGVISGYFSICSAKLSLSCNDYLLKVKYFEQYNVFNDLSLIYNNRKYDYREYRINNNMIEMCASNHSTVLHIWRTRNSFEKSRLLRLFRCNNRFELPQQLSSVSKLLTVYYSPRNQYFTTQDYDVLDGERFVCYEKFKPVSFQYTKEDLLMCNGSIINIKYDDQYKVWNNFSILYKKNMYNYTEYRALNDSIKICNSTDIFKKNIWKLRNNWVMTRRQTESCKIRRKFLKPYYTINKEFTVYYSGSSQYFTRDDYDVEDGEPFVCNEMFTHDSYQYTQEDLSMCNDSIIHIEYDDEYKVWNNFSILYKNEIYSYTEYRALNNSIKICNSTDNFMKNVWELRNKWVMWARSSHSCKEIWTYYKPHYSVNKQFTLYLSSTSQYFTKHDYDVRDGEPVVCNENKVLDSYKYTKEDLLMCNDSIININYEDEYKVGNDFSIHHKNKMYSSIEYRALNDSIKVCNATDNFTKNIWKLRNNWVKRARYSHGCKETWTFYKPYYSINKQFTAYESGSSQYFTRYNYDVRDSQLVVCNEAKRPNSFQYTQEDLSMCNDSIIYIKYDDEYKVWNNFSILYKSKMYSYTEYRALNDGIKICNSTDNFKKNNWKLRNDWVMARRHTGSCKTQKLNKPYYSINKEFTVYYSGSSQYFTRYEYDVRNGEPYVCNEIFTHDSYQYTQEDLSMCNDLIIKIEYDDEYKVWNNFSILYKNKIYSYTEYRALNYSIKICNSTDNFVKNVWELRNKWVIWARSSQSCKEIWTSYKPYYSVSKQFTVYLPSTSQYFTKHDYDVRDGELVICKQIVRSNSYHYTQEDLSMCNDSIINIKYEDEYKVGNDFSIHYKNKMYTYTEYRALNDSIKICNATDNFTKNVWKIRNNWVMRARYSHGCKETWTFSKPYYSINKQFTAYESGSSQYFTRYNYDVRDSELVVCNETKRPNSFQYTQEDLLMCNDSIINIKYEDEYNVWNNFSILYKSKMYSYTEYRAQIDGIKICNSTDNFKKNIWKLRNNWVMARRQTESCKLRRKFHKPYYFNNKEFTVYYSGSSQYLTRDDYDVEDGEPFVCNEMFTHDSYQYTQEDLSMCNDSIIHIEYDDEYKVWNNFSILYKNKIYSYTEYRALNDSIKICNSTEIFKKNIWKLRNNWVMTRRQTESCKIRRKLLKPYYSINKEFTVYYSGSSQYFTRDDYDVEDGEPFVCNEMFTHDSYQYTQEDLSMCNDSIIHIEYDEEYKVWNNFSILYKNKIYSYTEYRALNDSIKICNSTDNFMKNVWELRNKWVMWARSSHSCKEIWTYYKTHYSVNKQFTLYLSSTSKYFTKHDYDVRDGEPVVCNETKVHDSYKYTKEDLLMCNDSIININYEDEYKVGNDFSIHYKNKMYTYTEYRALNDSIKICNATDNFTKNVWKIRNNWVMRARYSHGCKETWTFSKPYYSINKQFTAYESGSSQYFTRYNYDVRDSELVVCNETKRPNSFQYTQEDLLMCNDSIINIKYEDEYNVWNNFSILYKSKMYSYTEYRALNDSIKICNSTDIFKKNIWKLRNNWVMARRQTESCKIRRKFYKPYYFINKEFTVYYSGSSQYFTRDDYDVEDGEPFVCNEMFTHDSYQYTQEDLSMCNDSIIHIEYDDEYKVWNNFSILYKNKMYSYTEYRALNNSIKICNSIDNFVKNIWKLRNNWVMGRRYFKSCNFEVWIFNKLYYSINKQFTVYLSSRAQYFTRHEYAVIEDLLAVCEEILRPTSYQYTKEDLLMCNDSIININYDDEYKVWNNFSILYKKNMYNYTEYRALNDSMRICNSTDIFKKNIWKLRNNWVMARRQTESCKIRRKFLKPYYSINKEFTVYYSGSSQYFTRDDYDVEDGEPFVCNEIFTHDSYQYTQEDLLMCNDSIIHINSDDEYKVWNNFSILYKNKMYSYTEYRALKDGIKVCHSTDNFVKNSWKLRNYWVILKRIFNSCNKPVVDFPLYLGEYDALKNFTVLIQATKLSIAKNEYSIFNGIPFLCVNKCVNSTSIINYEDEYRVWNNFTVMYKAKMYNYFEYRVTGNGLQICNSSDRLIKEKWRNLTALEKRSTAFSDCDVHVGGFYHENYTVYKNFSVFFKPTNQNFTRQDYGVISGYFAICSASLSFSCDKSLLEVQYGEQYEVFKNFSMFYERKVYDYSEYRLSLNGVKICTSSDVRVQAIWKTQNKWEKSLGAPCDRSYKLNAREYTVTKKFVIHFKDDGQVFNRHEYSVIDASPYVCKLTAKPNYIIVDVKIIVAPLFALALSFICLVLLFMVYCLLPQLRTLPGLNLMSLCFAFLLWQMYLVVFLSSYSHVGELSAIPCERLFVITKFITYSIVMNATVNIYHLRQTFCGITPIKSENLNKRRKFLKYSMFSWGIPVAVAIVYIVLLKTQFLQFNQYATSWKADVQSSLRFYQRIELDNEDTKGYVLNVDPHTKILVTKIVAPYVRPGQNFHDKGKPNISINEDEPQSKRFYKRVVLGNENDARIYQHITGDCINGRITPSWTTAVDVYGIQGCLMLYIVVAFILTAYHIRKKLKAGRSIAQNSNVVRHRKFILLLKLSTTTALSYWFPLFLSEMIDFNFDIKIALYTVSLLTGAYIGIAFGFTRRNYQLLKKKYFPAKERPVDKRVAAN